VLVSSASFSQYWGTQNSGFTTVSRGISGLEVFDANTVWALLIMGLTPMPMYRSLPKHPTVAVHGQQDLSILAIPL
jgi:hypothetical protein